MSEDRSQSIESREPFRWLTSRNASRYAGKTFPRMQSPLLSMPTCFAWVFVFFLMTPPLAQGQASTYARLVGTVRDQTGAVIPAVEFTATARATNASRSTITDDRGDYILDKLIPGQYDGLAELSGFKTQVLLDFRLEVTQVARQDFDMAPGEIAEQVTVRGQSTIIDTDNAEVRGCDRGEEDPGSGSWRPTRRV